MALLAVKQRSLIRELKETGISKEKLIKLFEELKESGDQGDDDQGSSSYLNLHQILDKMKKNSKKS